MRLKSDRSGLSCPNYFKESARERSGDFVLKLGEDKPRTVTVSEMLPEPIEETLKRYNWAIVAEGSLIACQSTRSWQSAVDGSA